MAERGRGHLLLAIVERLHGSHRIAQLGRLLEPLAVGCAHHPGPQRLDELVVLAFQKQPRHVHRAAVLLRRANRVHARRDASLDVVFEAGPAALPGNHFVARPDPEQPVRERHGLAREMRGQKRARVEAAVALDAPRHQHARKRLVGRQLQVGIVLVVAQQDVVFRRPLLDQVVFEGERLHDRVGDDDVEPRHLVEERIGLRIAAVGAEIVTDAVAQRPRLPDVNRVAGGVEVQIDAGLLRQPGNLLLEFVDAHTGTMTRFFSVSEPFIIRRPSPRVRPACR